MNRCARGTFEVKLQPLAVALVDAVTGTTRGRMSIDKQFSGDLTGSSLGEMLTAMTDVKGSAGYVAIEKVSGRLHGREGSFVLQHHATMTRGAPQLQVSVVPDSGTGALQGISGQLNIIVTDGQHRYEFDYELPGDSA